MSEPCLVFSFADLLLRTAYSHSTYYIYLFRFFVFISKVTALADSLWTKDVCLKSLLTYNANVEKQCVLRKTKKIISIFLIMAFFTF